MIIPAHIPFWRQYDKVRTGRLEIRTKTVIKDWDIFLSLNISMPWKTNSDSSVFWFSSTRHGKLSDIITCSECKHYVWTHTVCKDLLTEWDKIVQFFLISAACPTNLMFLCLMPKQWYMQSTRYEAHCYVIFFILQFLHLFQVHIFSLALHSPTNSISVVSLVKKKVSKSYRKLIKSETRTLLIMCIWIIQFVAYLCTFLGVFTTLWNAC